VHEVGLIEAPKLRWGRVGALYRQKCYLSDLYFPVPFEKARSSAAYFFSEKIAAQLPGFFAGEKKQ
jgi:hypothetical protein